MADMSCAAKALNAVASPNIFASKLSSSYTSFSAPIALMLDDLTFNLTKFAF
jgi:hypothetical protein